MNKQFKLKREILLVMLANVALCLFFLYGAGFAGAQNTCVPCTDDRPANGQQFAWAKDATITVNINPTDFADDSRRGAVQEAFSNWELNGSINGWGGHFVFTYNATFEPGPNKVQVNGGQLPPDSNGQPRGQTELHGDLNSGSLNYAIVTLDDRITDLTALAEAAAHETGHSFGLQDCEGCCAGSSTMVDPVPDINDTASDAEAPTACDTNGVKGIYQPGGGFDPACDCSDIIGCLECVVGIHGCFCSQFNPQSPIIIDVNHDGYELTDLWGGVKFDLDVKGRAGLTAWTTAGSDDAFLALDRNGNGVIDDGSELFGNNSKLADGATADNGWDALAVFDRVERGGNGDGLIDYHDAIYVSLRLWQDVNHNGMSEPNELFTLSELGVDTLSLDYQVEGRRDRNGNFFRFRSRVFGHDVVTGNIYKSFAFDVFFGIPKRLDR